MFILRKRFRFMDPDESSGSGTPVDRGDDFTPTGADLIDAENDDAMKAAAILDAARSGPADDEKVVEKAEKVVEKVDEKGDKVVEKKGAIPLDRHEKVLAAERGRRETVERELAQYKGGQQIADTNVAITGLETEITKLESDYSKLLVDGEHEKAAALMSKIRGLERDAGEKRSDMKIEAATARATERVRYDSAMERIEASYPVLNQDHDDYDADKASEVGELMQAYKVMGMTPTAALQKAVKLLMPAETAKQEKAVEVTPQVDAAEVAKAKAVILAADRKKSAIDKALETEKKQPPSLDKGGLDSDKMGVKSGKDITKNQASFAKASEEDKARLRGDVIA